MLNAEPQKVEWPWSGVIVGFAIDHFPFFILRFSGYLDVMIIASIAPGTKGELRFRGRPRIQNAFAEPASSFGNNLLRSVDRNTHRPTFAPDLVLSAWNTSV